jgi:hypothetical protein
MKTSDVGSNELNQSRDAHNDRVDKKAMLGNTKTAQWRRKRRNKPI